MFCLCFGIFFKLGFVKFPHFAKLRLVTRYFVGKPKNEKKLGHFFQGNKNIKIFIPQSRFFLKFTKQKIKVSKQILFHFSFLYLQGQEVFQKN